MKEKLKKYYWILFIILAIGAVFYWYQYRPAQARKECAKYLTGFNTVYSKGNYYEKCLSEHGIEK